MGKKRNLSGKKAKAARAEKRRKMYPPDLVKAVADKIKKEDEQKAKREAKKPLKKPVKGKQLPKGKPNKKAPPPDSDSDSDSDDSDDGMARPGKKVSVVRSSPKQQAVPEDPPSDSDDEISGEISGEDNGSDDSDDSDDDIEFDSDEGAVDEGEGLLLGDLPPGLYQGSDVPHIQVPGNCPKGFKPKPKPSKSKRTYGDACDEDELPSETLVITTVDSDDEEPQQEVEEEEEDRSGEDEEDEEEEGMELDDEEDDDEDDLAQIAKMAADDDEEDDDDDEEESDEEELMRMSNMDEQEEVELSFEFFDPKEEDFHGIKMFLRSFLSGRNFNDSELADHVCTQTRVGTCVKGDENSFQSLFGFVSVVNLRQHKEKEFVKQIKKCILDECPDEKTRAQLKQIILDPKERVGLLVCEKFANFPVELLGPLNRAISDEISWAQEDEPTETLKRSFKFSKYIKICSAFDADPAAQPVAGKKKKKQSKPEPLYKFLDDEIMANHATLTYGFKNCMPTTEAATATSQGMAQRRHVVVLEANKLPVVVEQLTEVLTGV